MTKHLKVYVIHKYDNQKQIVKLAIEIGEQSNTGNIFRFYQEFDLLGVCQVTLQRARLG